MILFALCVEHLHRVPEECAFDSENLPKLLAYHKWKSLRDAGKL